MEQERLKKRKSYIFAHLRVRVRRKVCDDLICPDAVTQRPANTIAGNCSNHKIGKPSSERCEQVQNRNLEGVIGVCV